MRNKMSEVHDVEVNCGQLADLETPLVSDKVFTYLIRNLSFFLFQESYIIIDLGEVYTVGYVKIWNNPTQCEYFHCSL